MPSHIAIIMDGNGRWAKNKNLKRLDGHKKGVSVVKKITTHCVKLKIEYLTLYTFSNENWFRPKKEVLSLMKLFVSTLNKEINLLIKNNIRFRVIGDKSKLDFITKNKINDIEKLTNKNTGMNMILAMSYGSRQEILTAINNIIINEKTAIKEDKFSEYLFTNGIKDPDLLIRTGKEKRISNFLLWQIAYAEIYFSDILWPNFTEHDLDLIISDFQKRERRYGKTSQQVIS
jgi:undecaprenyl diphosphate synthase